jgi:hypothetical protein
LKPWAVNDLGEFAMTPSDPVAQREVMAGLPPGSNVETIDVESEAIRMLEIQRKIKIEHRNHAEGISIVGGFAMITSVTATAIQSKILRRWSDKIGDKIDPTRASFDPWKQAWIDAAAAAPGLNDEAARLDL